MKVGPVPKAFRQARWKRPVLLLVGLVLFSCLGLGLMSMFSQRPENLGVVDGRLSECPTSPNCVSSQTKSGSHRMPPIAFAGNPSQALDKLKQIIAQLFPRARLVDESECYLRYEFTSFLFRFVDDVEFLADNESQQVHFRSASRVGHSDLGANRNRMMKIFKEFQR